MTTMINWLGVVAKALSPRWIILAEGLSAALEQRFEQDRELP